MAQLFTLGGDRIGSGNKQKVALHNYEMNSFNLEQDFKSSLAPGILYPFVKAVGTNHGTFDIDLDTFVRTLPTKGPLFGSFKMQIDLYSVPFRLYQGVLHNNPIDIGLSMNQVYLPKLKFSTIDGKDRPKVGGTTEDDEQVNTSALMKYLGLSGIGHYYNQNVSQQIYRKINAVPLLAYYDIFKCYYSNKQEENAYVITPGTPTKVKQNIYRFTTVYSDGEGNERNVAGTTQTRGWNTIYYQVNGVRGGGTYVPFAEATYHGSNLDANYITLDFYYKSNGSTERQTGITLQSLIEQDEINVVASKNEIKISDIGWSYLIETYASEGDVPSRIDLHFNDINNQLTADIELTPFKLKNIDKMRYALLKENELGTEFVIGDSNFWDASSGEDQTGLPYSALFKTTTDGITWNAFAQNGLVVKTYQSDLFNNWLDTSYIDGPNGIAAITAVDTTNGSFTMDTLNLAEKFYELLNRIVVAGGTYQDWQDAVYGEGAVRMCETPMYIGGMSSEIMFEEVIATTENGTADQALGSLGGKGTQVGKKGGNNIHVKMDEPGYILGIVSFTPRICYSQGNDWDLTELDTLDDLHKPALDGIGFQNLMVEQFAWWNTLLNSDGTVFYRGSAGKQTAWINYQTAVDKCYGDFAKTEGLAFMVLNRNYEHTGTINQVKDITTYIDPVKYNYAFAYAQLDAQNFWAQIHTKMTARRKMGAQQIPNL